MMKEKFNAGLLTVHLFALGCLISLSSVILTNNIIAEDVVFIAVPSQNKDLKPILKKGDRVAIVGDSITEQRAYSKFIEMYLLACQPQLDLQIMQFGWSGERAQGFAGRMDSNLMPFKPNVVTTCYGMNDGGYRPFEEAIGKAYEIPMRDIVTRLKAAGVTVLVGSPGAVDTKYYAGGDSKKIADYNDNLSKLGELAKKVADEAGMPFANVHDALMNSMEKGKAAFGAEYDVCGKDGVHPGANGHIVMAYAFLKAMGLDGEIGKITIDLKGNSTGSDGHKIVSSGNGSVEIESSRYPFCFFGDDKSSGSTRSILPFVAFNDDLNRFVLVVKNFDSENAKVTWGAETKTFTREQLEKGINLAVEFPVNPFCENFKKLDSVVSSKEVFETGMIKNAMTNFPWVKQFFPEDKEVTAALNTISEKLWAKQNSLAKDVRGAVVPVKHKITISK